MSFHHRANSSWPFKSRHSNRTHVFSYVFQRVTVHQLAAADNRFVGITNSHTAIWPLPGLNLDLSASADLLSRFFALFDHFIFVDLSKSC